MNIIVIDDFFEDPDSIRNYALDLDYRNPNNEGWLGYRCFTHSKEYVKLIASKVKKVCPSFTMMIYYFHYCLEETKLTYPKDFNSFDDYKIHQDPECKFAGLVYLHPDPPKNTGTSFYNKSMKCVTSIENKYNRFIFYSSDIYHGPTDLFGTNKEDGRLTLTVFCK